VYAGWQFASFVDAARRGLEPLPVRPPAVEAYLPITGLMGLVDWIYRGALNAVHPAATTLLLTFLAMSLLLRRSFCSWVCPVGLLSETLARLGQRAVGRNLRIGRLADLAMRGLRYVLLGFFLWAILGMSPADLGSFINSPYNRVADVKMYMFFERIGTTAILVLASLAIGSVLVNGFWCRYLCPYGALLGLASRLSPVRVSRDESLCIDCGRCDGACPAGIAVSRSTKVGGVECTGCLDCLASCPSPGSLSARARSRPIRVAAFAVAVLALFVISYSTARLTGHWRNAIGDPEYIEHLSRINTPAYAHPGAAGPGPPRDDSAETHGGAGVHRTAAAEAGNAR
jgi:polyferredoxin